MKILESLGSSIPFYQPQGSIFPIDSGKYELAAFAFVPNGNYDSDSPIAGAPKNVSISESGLAHVTLPLIEKRKVESAIDLQPKPVHWLSKTLNLGENLSHVAVHVTIDDKLVSTRIIDLKAYPKDTTPTQKLSALEQSISNFGDGKIDPLRILVKMKDTGF